MLGLTGGILGALLGLLGAVIGIVGGLVGTFIGIKSAKSPRERAFAIKASITLWIGFAVLVPTFVLGMCLIPGCYKIFLIPIYVLGLGAGFLLLIRRASKIRSDDQKRGD